MATLAEVTFCCFLLVALVMAGDRVCSHRSSLSELQLGVELGHHPIMKRQVTQRASIRFYVHYHAMVSDLEAEKSSLIKEVVEAAVKYWESTLTVGRTTAPISLLRACAGSADSTLYVDGGRVCLGGCANVTTCGSVAVPEEHLAECNGPGSNGVADADYILYVSVATYLHCQNNVAYASYCQLDKDSNRPVAGFINFCPSGLSPHEFQRRLSISVGVHEMAHSLGFSDQLYGLYRDPAGAPFTDRDNITGLPPMTSSGVFRYSDRVIRPVTRFNWKLYGRTIQRTVYMVVTPAVQEAVRLHFNCSDLEGAELEEGGLPGTRFTHWEKRVFGNEALTGVYTHDPVVSNITLALMYDTGWYGVNFTMAEPLEYGRGLGCPFAKESCLSRLERELDVEPFCKRIRTDPMRTRCIKSRRSLTVCNLMIHDGSLPLDYRYFENPSMGGRISLADYCPVVEGFHFENDNVISRGSDCFNPLNQPVSRADFALEGYGSSSVCIEQPGPFKVYGSTCSNSDSAKVWGAGCYQYECSPEGLQLSVRQEVYHCSPDGAVVDVAVKSSGLIHVGQLQCPRCLDLCSAQQCSGAPSLSSNTRPTVTDLCNSAFRPPLNGLFAAVYVLLTFHPLYFH